jgi:hypothetical protein
MHSRRKVLAGIVMTTGPQMEDAKVISVATGTKCINGEHMSVRGASLNDTHAEIIARRCLCDFIYSQLEMHTDPGLLKICLILFHIARMSFNCLQITTLPVPPIQHITQCSGLFLFKESTV